MSKGFTFLEILLSLFLISLLLLGVDGALVASLRQVKTNLYFSTAIQQLAVITERLKLMGGTHVVEEWNRQNKQVLPQANGGVHKNKDGYDIFITWGGYKEKDCQKNKIGESGCLKTSIKLE